MKTRITITIDSSVLEKLPKYGKSGVVNEILKRHFQNEGAEQLWEFIKGKILEDKDIGEWIAVEGGTKSFS